MSWRKRNRCWVAQIKAYGVVKFIGYYACEFAAAQAYDDAGFARNAEHFTPNFLPIAIEITR